MALTAQDQQDLMYLIVGTFNAAPGRTIFNDLAEMVINDYGGMVGIEVAETLVDHPLFSDNSDGEYPISQTNEQFAQEYLTELLGARGTWVEASAWDEANDIVVANLNGGTTRAELVLAATQYLQNNPSSAFAAAADALANKVEVALFQAVELEQDASGSTLGSLRATISGVDNTQASVDAAKDLVENGPTPGGTTFNLTAGTAAGADVMRLTGDQDVRIDFTDSSNQITGLDLDGDGTIERDGVENNQSGIAADFEIVDAYARNPLNQFDSVNNFLGDIFHDGTGVDGDGVSTDGNIVLGGLGSDTIFGGIGNDFLAGGGVSTSRFGYADDSFDREADHLIGGRNADFFFVSLPLMNLTIDDLGSFSDGYAVDIDGGNTADDNGPFGDTNQDSDWLLIEASDDDEPVEIYLWTDESQSITTRAGRFAAIREIEHVDASGNLYGFLDDVD
ncbi:MAG: hypothetical protein KJN90_04225, partial [Gammaproteobacteria bacterium]|nr:hypothetical protein [Gammaproteobacteria bacterium]